MTYVPPTEGIKYIGSKLKLIPQILKLASKVGAKTVLDGFSGTTRVSQAFAKCDYQVVSNDVSVWSKVFANCYLMNQKPTKVYQPLIDHLNSIPSCDGWFSKYYGGHANGGFATQSDNLKKPWQLHNTRKLDAIRLEIERLSLSPVDKAIALTSLILALDQVDNTLGHFSSYLREWSPRSYKNLELKVPKTFITKRNHRIFQRDIFKLIPEVSVDLAYFDPPYGSNNEKMPPSRVRYSSYYHLWTTICLFDSPSLFGKVRRRKDTSDKISGSIFEEFRKDDENRFIAVQAIGNLIKNTQAKWIILSYSSGGRATACELNDILSQSGRLIDVLDIDYKKNVMANMKWTNDWVGKVNRGNREFLFLLEKDR